MPALRTTQGKQQAKENQIGGGWKQVAPPMYSGQVWLRF